jgi:hypothetical protein
MRKIVSDITLFTTINLLTLGRIEKEYTSIKYIISITLIINWIRRLLLDNKYYHTIKEALFISGIIIYLYKDSYLQLAYNNLFYYLLLIIYQYFNYVYSSF